MDKTSTTTTTIATTEYINTSALNRRAIVGAMGIGVGVGVFGWLLMLLIRDFFIATLFCRSVNDFGICSNSSAIAWGIAFICVGVLSIFALVRAGVYRPLLVVVAVFVTLWGVASWLAPLEWYWILVWHAVFFGLAYTLFAWLATIERFLYSFIATVLVVLLVRLALL